MRGAAPLDCFSSALSDTLEARDEIGRWWREYNKADGDGKVSLIRGKLELAAENERWADIVDEAIVQLSKHMPDSEYLSFLEWVRDSHRTVFERGIQWHVLEMLWILCAQRRMEKIDELVLHYADCLKKIDEPFFAIMTITRLAGREQAARYLTQKSLPREVRIGLMPHAIDELDQWSMTDIYRDCLASGLSDEAIEQMQRRAEERGWSSSETAASYRREFLLRLAGKLEPISREELMREEEKGCPRFSLMLVDFVHWMVEGRGIAPVVADELHTVLVDAVNSMELDVRTYLKGLDRNALEKALCHYVDFLSLARVHAPASLVALIHLYDFFSETGLTAGRTRDEAHATCIEFWRQLKTCFGAIWPRYSWVGDYLPDSLRSELAAGP